MNKVQADYWRNAAGVEPALPVTWLKRLGKRVAALRRPKTIPAEVFPVLRELDRLRCAFDDEPFTHTPEFKLADRLGLIDSGGGFSTGHRLSPKGHKALDAVLQKGRP